jgi:hypothetical protein
LAVGVTGFTVVVTLSGVLGATDGATLGSVVLDVVVDNGAVDISGPFVAEPQAAIIPPASVALITRSTRSCCIAKREHIERDTEA